MQQFRNIEEAYDICLTQGNIIPTEEIDHDRIRLTLRLIEEDIETAKDAMQKKRWNSTYKSNYDILHQLTEAFLRFDRIKVKTHLCLFTYLCLKHPELELNWDFFERVRTKRNGSLYYANPITEQDWKEVSLPFNLYINQLKNKIKEKLEK